VDAFKAFEAERWSAKAESYDLVTGRVTRRVVRPLLDAAGVGAGVRLLDLATGPGHMAAAAADRGAAATGVDIAAGMLALAREREPRVHFVEGDAEALPFEDGEFDAAVAAFVFNHLPQPEAAAAELARVLAPGSRLALCVWDAPPRSRLVRLLGEATRAAGAQADGAVPAGPDTFRFAHTAELEALFAGAGFERPAIEALDLTLEAGDPDELWRGMLGGSVRGAAMVETQDEPTRERIRGEFDRLVDDLDGRIPCGVRLAGARRP
jgi:ubiquinone/menaquinone biosynthesis C-methylase UbiE